MLNIILFGPPGSGKGTQSELLVKKYNLFHISTGDIFRAEIKGKTDLGTEAKSYIDKGELVPDSVTINMLAKHVDAAIKSGVKGFIFDGFPRTIPQAEALDTMLTARNTELSAVLALHVNDDELRSRLLERGKTSGRADDTNMETINNRIQVYKDETSPVASHYEAQNKLFKIEGVGEIKAIFNRLSSVLDSL